MSIELLTIDKLPEYVDLQIAAYPSMGIGTKEFIEKQIKIWIKTMDDNVLLYGHFDGSKMTGCMAIYPFSMNYLNNYLPASGIGSVAVHPLHPEKIIPLLPIIQSPTSFDGKSIAFVIQDPFIQEDKIYQYQIVHNKLIQTDRILSSETVKFSMASFSSLCTGSLPFEPAYKNGIVKLSNPSWFSFFTAFFNIPKPTYNVNF